MNSLAVDLGAMGKSSRYFGPVGYGTRMKIPFNMLMGNCLAALGESLTLCEKVGISPKAFMDTFAIHGMNSPFLLSKGNGMVAATYSTHFPTEHAEKDMRIGVEMGVSAGVSLPVTTAAQQLYKRALGKHAGKDFSSVVEQTREESSK